MVQRRQDCGKPTTLRRKRSPYCHTRSMDTPGISNRHSDGIRAPCVVWRKRLEGAINTTAVTVVGMRDWTRFPRRKHPRDPQRGQERSRLFSPRASRRNRSHPRTRGQKLRTSPTHLIVGGHVIGGRPCRPCPRLLATRVSGTLYSRHGSTSVQRKQRG